MRKFKKAFITGISGSGGSYLADYIFNNQKEIRLFGNYRNKLSRNIKKLKNKATLFKCDLNNYQKLFLILSKIRPDVIFHFASDADVRMSFYYPREFIQNNNNCTLNLLEAIRVLNIDPVILICSTSEVYGQVSNKHKSISEKEILKPINPYAVSKTFQDIVAYNYFLCFNLKIIITRMFTYINPRRLNLFASGWAYQIAKIEAGQKKILYHGNLDSVRTIIDIEDAMEAYWAAAAKGKIGEIYNIGGSKKIKLKKILDILISKSRVKIKTKLDKKLLRKTDISYQIPNFNKFKKHTKWKPKVNFEISIDNLLKEMRIRVTDDLKN